MDFMLILNIFLGVTLGVLSATGLIVLISWIRDLPEKNNGYYSERKLKRYLTKKLNYWREQKLLSVQSPKWNRKTRKLILQYVQKNGCGSQKSEIIAGITSGFYFCLKYIA